MRIFNLNVARALIWGLITPTLVLLALGGCLPFARTGSNKVADAIPPHQSWCYRTLGRVDCYAKPQNFPAERLVIVDPESQQPITPDAYRRAVAEGH